MGFREDLEEILDATPAERRTLLFSATMPQPIVALAHRYQRDALPHLDRRRRSRPWRHQLPGRWRWRRRDIENAVVNLLRFHEAETAMLFCATREAMCDISMRVWSSAASRAVALSGEHSQNERNARASGAA